jgi:hypothetical protein
MIFMSFMVKTSSGLKMNKDFQIKHQTSEGRGRESAVTQSASEPVNQIENPKSQIQNQQSRLSPAHRLNLAVAYAAAERMIA